MSAPSLPSIKPTPEQLQKAIGRIENFSPAPAILARAMLLIRDNQSDLGSIAALIRGDPALSTDILRMANSAYYGPGLQTESVEHALQKIGCREASRLLNVAVSRGLTHTDLVNYCITAGDFWAESLFHGLFLEKLATATGEGNPDEAYTAGLLRYIGRLAINRAIEELGGGLHWVGTEALTTWEQTCVGFTHAHAGAILLERWNFPASLVEGCRGQENPAILPEPNWLAAALHFTASVLPQDFDMPFNPVLELVADSGFLHLNGLTPGIVESLFAETQVDCLKIRESFA